MLTDRPRQDPTARAYSALVGFKGALCSRKGLESERGKEREMREKRKGDKREEEGNSTFVLEG